jgi:hypothetical protein
MTERSQRLLDKLRKKKAGTAVPAAGAGAKPTPTPTPTPKREPKPECSPGEIITYRCGCKVGVQHLRGTLCPGCRHARWKEKHLREQGGEGGRESGQRLPDNAKFETLYDAASTSWTGTLTVPGCPIFEDTQSGVVGLLAALDRQCRQWQTKQAQLKETTHEHS